MLSRGTLFEYRAWPSEKMPHIEALHHLFGFGVSEIRTDTYILSPYVPDWMMVLRGGTQFEIRMKTADQEPLSVWTAPLRCKFPLSGQVVRMLQQAFPLADLPRHIAAPVDLLSGLDRSAVMCTVSQRMVHFDDGDCTAELTNVNINGRRMETFCLSSKQCEPILEVLKALPGPRLPNWDYSTWLQRRIFETPLQPVAAAPAPIPALESAEPAQPRNSLVENAKLYAAKAIPAWSEQFGRAAQLGRKASAKLRQWRPSGIARNWLHGVTARIPSPEPAPARLQFAGAIGNDEPLNAVAGGPARLPMALSTRFVISDHKDEASIMDTWRCSRESIHIEARPDRPY